MSITDMPAILLVGWWRYDAPDVPEAWIKPKVVINPKRTNLDFELGMAKKIGRVMLCRWRCDAISVNLTCGGFAT